MYLNPEQIFTLLSTLLFLELFIAALTIWAWFRLSRMQNNLGDLGREKYQEILKLHQQQNLEMMDEYKEELKKLTASAAKKYEAALEKNMAELQNTAAKSAEGLTKSVEETKQEMLAQVEADLNEFKQAKIAETEKAATGIAEKAALRLIGTQLSNSDQQKIVKELLAEAWGEGSLPNE